ncbi:hypothetical protein SBA5_80062 [Candidatus Sulfotelmatomonas gaucii]|uniref:Uncharacterized protein n=1 Tax=Candidatus Sulfuritelmatomonas gaucii TaxID=2043161 RepID=A0A2N9M5D6_9BACT|nr:hypothetical protein SBA5_80062 [Candidatus Sulfotelmatomonas gaucii]
MWGGWQWCSERVTREQGIERDGPLFEIGANVRSSQLLFEKGYGALPGEVRGGGVVACAGIAVEGVTGVEPMDFDVGVRRVNRFGNRGRNVGILAAEVQHDRAIGCFGSVFADLAAVVTDGGGGMKACRGKPGDAASEAVTDDANFLARRFGCVVDSGRHVDDGFLDVDFGDQAHGGLHVGAFVAELNAGLDAIKERGCDAQEAVVREAVGNGANVSIDAEDFLNDHEPGDGLARRARDVGAQRVAVRRVQNDGCAHWVASGGESSICGAPNAHQVDPATPTPSSKRTSSHPFAKCAKRVE